MDLTSYLRTITVGEKKYELEVCTAETQWDIVVLFMQYGLSDALYNIATGEHRFVAAALFGSLMKSASRSELDDLTKKLIGSTKDLETGKLVNIADFHCNMFLYVDLHLQALKENFADFTHFLDCPPEKTEQEEE